MFRLVMVLMLLGAMGAPVRGQAPVVDVSQNPSQVLSRSACVSRWAGPSAAMQCSELMMAHAMPAFRTMDTDRSLTLLYTSGTAIPGGVIRVNVSAPAGTPPATDTMRAVLTMNGVTRTYRFQGTGFVAGGAARRITLPVSAADFSISTGVHPYSLTVTRVRNGVGSYPTTVSGQVLVVDRRTSPYGAGWDLAGTQQLWLNQLGTNSVLLTHGDGSGVLYESIGTGLWRAAPGAYRDTLRYGTTGTRDSVPVGTWYWRTTLDATRTYFDPANGRMRFSVDRYWNKVEYAWKVVSGATVLDYIRIAPWDRDFRYVFQYDANGKLDRITDPANRVLEATVAAGLLTHLRDPGIAIGYETEFEYTDNFIIRRRSPSLHNTWYSRYAGSGYLHQSALPTGGAQTLNPEERLALGNVQAGAAGFVRSVALDSVSGTIDGYRDDVADTTRYRTNGTLSPVWVRDPVGLAVQITYANSAFPLLPTSVVLPDGQSWTVSHDASGRDTAATSHAPGLPSITSRMTYSTSAREAPALVIRPRAGGVDTTIFTYPAGGRLTQVRDPRGNLTSFGYGQNDQVTTITAHAVRTWVSDAAPDDVQDQVTHLSYGNDFRNNDTIRTPLGNVTKVLYDAKGRPHQVRDPMNALTLYTYGDMNWPAAIVQYDSLGNQLTPTLFYTDNEGNVTQRTDARGISRWWSYDAIGRQHQMAEANGAVETNTYDKAGNLIAFQDRMGYTVTNMYDAAGRVTRRVSPPIVARDAAEASLYRAPLNKQVVAADTIRTFYSSLTGRVDSIVNRFAGIRLGYDGRGRVVADTQVHRYRQNAPVYAHRYGYYDTGERMQSVLPSGLTHDYTYDAGSLLKTITPQGPRGGLMQFSYDQLGRRQQITLPMSAYTGHWYDADGRTRKILTRSSVTDSIRVNLKYIAYDSAARPRTIQDSTSASLAWQLLRYDAGLGFQISDQLGTTTTKYRYDAVGNRLHTLRAAWDSTVFTYQSAPTASNRLVAMTDYLYDLQQIREQYFHDRNGTRIGTEISKPGDTTIYNVMLYDAWGRLREIPDFSAPSRDTMRSYYDGLGREIARIWYNDTTNKGEFTFGYDGVNVSTISHFGVAEFLHGPGVDDLLTAYLPAATQMCGTGAVEPTEAWFTMQGPRLLGFFNDNLRDCRGTLAWTSFGRQAGGISNSHSFSLSRGGAEGGSGYSYFRNRWYDASSGRFMSEDPLGYEGGMNLYAYGNNNPATFTDPFGLSPEIGDEESGCIPCLLRLAQAARRVGPAIATAARAGGALARTHSFQAAGIVARGGAVAQVGQRSIPIIRPAMDKLNERVVSNFGGTAQQWVSTAISQGQRFTDTAHSGNISYYLNSPGRDMIRVTLDPTGSRVISAGLNRTQQVQDWIASGRLVR